MISIIITNYNCPKEVDSLMDFLLPRVKIPSTFTVLDNGSDPDKISKHTTIRLDTNRNKLGGVLTALHLSSRNNPDYYWILSTSMHFNPFDGDPADEIIQELCLVENTVSVRPGFTGKIIHRPHKATAAREGSRFHEAVIGPGAFSMFDANWLDSIGWFDPSLTSSWGIDFEFGYLLKKTGKKHLISDTVTVSIDESGKYAKDISSYQEECRNEMIRVLSRKYGANWEQVLEVERQLCGT